MFIGVAPRGTEDVSGVGFLGQEGRILKHIFKMVPHNFEFYCTYLVACRTGDIIYNGEFTDQYSEIDTAATHSLSIIDEDRYPSVGEIKACQPHLYDIQNEFAPQFIVHLGSYVNKHAPKLAIKRATLVLDSLEYIASLEYKLLTVRRNAHKLTQLLSEHSKAIQHVYKN
jgi:uracil-DNA glycosylase